MTARHNLTTALARLRAALLASDYEEHARTARYARASFSSPESVPASIRERRGGPRLGHLVDLFAYGRELDERATRRALGAADPAVLARAGLLQRRPGGWRSRVSIGGHGDVFVFGDLARRGQRRDHVDGHTTAAELARQLAVPIGPGQRLLDLGTGSGIHALLAARAGATAVGADINPHALHLAALGAELNDIDGADWRQGSWYGPVAGERFERVICVAPYVVSPDSEFTFRDGDRTEGEPLRVVAAGALAHLAPGGCAQLMCCWGHGADEDWRRTPLRWLGRGGDALLVRLSEANPVRYALDWNRPPMRALGPAAHDRVMARWLDYYARAGYDRISFGALYLRRRAAGRTGGQSREALDTHGAPGEHGGTQIGRALANLELLARAREDDVLLALAPAIPEGQRVEQRLQHEGPRYRLRWARVSQAGGLRIGVEVSARVLEVIYRLDGRRTLAQALLDVGASGRERTDETLQATRELLRAGLLEVPETG